MLPVGGKVSEVEFGEQLVTLFLHTLPLLTEENITLGSSAKETCTGVYIQNCRGLNPFYVLRDILADPDNVLHFVTMIWDEPLSMTGADMEILGQLAVAYDQSTGEGFGHVNYDPDTGTLSNAGPKAVLQGTINVTTPMYQDTAQALAAFFGSSLVINCSTYYVRFEDAAVMNICATNWGDWHWEYQPNAGNTGGYDIVATVNASHTGDWDLVGENYVANSQHLGGYDITETANTGAGAYDKVKVGDGITAAQCAAVSSIGTTFKSLTNISKFNEFVYFTSVTTLANSAFASSSIEEILLPPNITRISASCFMYANNIKELIIPANVSYIGDWGLNGQNNSKLVKVTMLGTTPPTISSTANFVDSKRYFYVPAESLTAYKSANVWSSHANNILPMSELTE